MSVFAVVVDSIVENVIVAESKEIAEEVTGKLCIECSDSSPAQISGTWDGTRFIPVKPYPSWILNEEFEWQAPVSKPEDNKQYDWDESTQSWLLSN
jgi:hypothetical protein